MQYRVSSVRGFGAIEDVLPAFYLESCKERSPRIPARGESGFAWSCSLCWLLNDKGFLQMSQSGIGLGMLTRLKGAVFRLMAVFWAYFFFLLQGACLRDPTWKWQSLRPMFHFCIAEGGSAQWPQLSNLLNRKILSVVPFPETPCSIQHLTFEMVY